MIRHYAWVRDHAKSEPYIVIIDLLLSGEITGREFCLRFLDLWRDDRDSHRWGNAAIDRLMTAVDCFEDEPEAGNPFEIGLAELRAEARRAVEVLRR